MTTQESNFDENHLGSVDFEYPDDEREGESPIGDLRQTQLQALNFMANMILSARTDQVRHMRVSVAISLLNGNLKLGEIADHYHVTHERVRQVVKEISAFEILPRP